MFSIKISSTAKSIGGIDVFFERSPDLVLSSDPREAPVAGHLRPEQRPHESDGGDRGDESRTPSLPASARSASCRTSTPTRLRPRAPPASIRCWRDRRSRRSWEASSRAHNPPGDRGEPGEDDQGQQHDAPEAGAASGARLRRPESQAVRGAAVRRATPPRARPRSGIGGRGSAPRPSALPHRVPAAPSDSRARRRRAAMHRPSRRHHLVQHRADRIDVRAFVGRFAPRFFGRGVVHEPAVADGSSKPMIVAR